MMADLASEHGEQKAIMIDANYLKARRTATNYIGARALLSSLPDVDWLLGDRKYEADWFREALKDKGIRLCILCRKQRKKTVVYDKRR